MKILHTFQLNRVKWRHWLLLVLLLLVTLAKMIPLWGFIYTTRSEERQLFQEEGCIRKSGRIPALGICLVLHRLGIELLPAEYL